MPEPNQTIKLFSRLRLNCLSSSSKHLEETTDDNRMHLRSQTAFRNDELYDAINLGDADKCKELLAMGVINLREGDCASCASQEAVRYTLPLQYAVMHREPEIIKVLLRHGADPDSVDIEGKTAIHTLVLYWPRCVPRDDSFKSHEIVAYQRYLRAVDLLCRESLRRLCAFGGSPNARDNRQQSPLHYAARYDIPGAASVLLDYGAYRDARDIDRKTPIMLAAAMGHDSLKVLLEAKPNVHLTCVEGKTALHHAVESRCPQHKKQVCVKMLLREGADPNMADKTGQTALHIACKVADENVITCLLQTGADADIRDANYMKPLHLFLDNPNNILNKRTILKLVDATLSYRSLRAKLPQSIYLPGLEPLAEAFLIDRSPPPLQRICRKIIRRQLVSLPSDKTQEEVMEVIVARLPLPKSLQRFVVMDTANPVRQIILGMKLFQST